MDSSSFSSKPVYGCPWVRGDPNCDDTFCAPYSGAKANRRTADLRARRARRSRSPGPVDTSLEAYDNLLNDTSKVSANTRTKDSLYGMLVAYLGDLTASVHGP